MFRYPSIHCYVYAIFRPTHRKVVSRLCTFKLQTFVRRNLLSLGITTIKLSAFQTRSNSLLIKSWTSRIQDGSVYLSELQVSSPCRCLFLYIHPSIYIPLPSLFKKTSSESATSLIFDESIFFKEWHITFVGERKKKENFTEIHNLHEVGLFLWSTSADYNA